MEELSLREIQLTELDILKSFDRFCKEEGLRYSLAGGTLLGAVRHQGFIPWDDDVDLFMSRPDYMRLIELYDAGKRLDREEYQMVSFEQGTFDTPYMKIVDKSTKARDGRFDERNGDSLWIDVFPIDGLPGDDSRLETIFRKIDRQRVIIRWCQERLGFERTPLRYAIKKYIVRPFARSIGERRCSEKIRKLAEQIPYEQADYVGAVTWGLYGTGERMKKSEFETIGEMVFEDGSYPVISCWHTYLTNIYGDYMQLPPEEKRHTHGLRAWKLNGSGL